MLWLEWWQGVQERRKVAIFALGDKKVVLVSNEKWDSAYSLLGWSFCYTKLKSLYYTLDIKQQVHNWFYVINWCKVSGLTGLFITTDHGPITLVISYKSIWIDLNTIEFTINEI